MERIDYAEGIRTKVLDGDVIRDFYDLDTEDQEYRVENEGGASEYHELSLKKQSEIDSQNLDKENYYGKGRGTNSRPTNKFLRRKKKRLREALNKTNGWKTQHVVSAVITYIGMTSMVILG